MRHFKHVVRLRLRVVFHFDDIFPAWNVEGEPTSLSTVVAAVIRWLKVYLQALKSKCLLCPYVTFDLSVIVSVVVFIIYGAFKRIGILDRNGSFFIFMKLIPSSIIFSYYRELEE